MTERDTPRDTIRFPPDEPGVIDRILETADQGIDRSAHRPEWLPSVADLQWHRKRLSINVALDILLTLHERTDDGALRDEISHVRHALHEWKEEVDDD